MNAERSVGESEGGEERIGCMNSKYFPRSSCFLLEFSFSSDLRVKYPHSVVSAKVSCLYICMYRLINAMRLLTYLDIVHNLGHLAVRCLNENFAHSTYQHQKKYFESELHRYRGQKYIQLITKQQQIKKANAIPVQQTIQEDHVVRFIRSGLIRFVRLGRGLSVSTRILCLNNANPKSLL